MAHGESFSSRLHYHVPRVYLVVMPLGTCHVWLVKSFRRKDGTDARIELLDLLIQLSSHCSCVWYEALSRAWHKSMQTSKPIAYVNRETVAVASWDWGITMTSGAPLWCNACTPVPTASTICACLTSSPGRLCRWVHPLSLQAHALRRWWGWLAHVTKSQSPNTSEHTQVCITMTALYWVLRYTYHMGNVFAYSHIAHWLSSHNSLIHSPGVLRA